MTKAPELVELLFPYLCPPEVVNVWVVLDRKDEERVLLANAENDVTFWAPERNIAPVTIR